MKEIAKAEQPKPTSSSCHPEQPARGDQGGCELDVMRQPRKVVDRSFKWRANERLDQRPDRNRDEPERNDITPATSAGPNSFVPKAIIDQFRSFHICPRTMGTVVAMWSTSVTTVTPGSMECQYQAKFDDKPYYETVVAMDRFLASIGWLEGEPTLSRP